MVTWVQIQASVQTSFSFHWRKRVCRHQHDPGPRRGWPQLMLAFGKTWPVLHRNMPCRPHQLSSGGYNSICVITCTSRQHTVCNSRRHSLLTLTQSRHFFNNSKLAVVHSAETKIIILNSKNMCIQRLLLISESIHKDP